MKVTRLDRAQLTECIGDLADLLVDTVADGASVGFLGPLDRTAALTWWKERAGAVGEGRLAVWVAGRDGRTVGTVSLAFADKPNSRHRATSSS